MADPVPVIAISGLTQHYEPPESGLLAVDHTSFEVCPGEVLGFPGSNDAGKKTTLRLLARLSDPTAGRTQVLGLDRSHQILRIGERIGIMDRLRVDKVLAIFHGVDTTPS